MFVKFPKFVLLLCHLAQMLQLDPGHLPIGGNNKLTSLRLHVHVYNITYHMYMQVMLVMLLMQRDHYRVNSPISLTYM